MVFDEAIETTSEPEISYTGVRVELISAPAFIEAAADSQTLEKMCFCTFWSYVVNQGEIMKPKWLDSARMSVEYRQPEIGLLTSG